MLDNRTIGNRAIGNRAIGSDARRQGPKGGQGSERSAGAAVSGGLIPTAVVTGVEPARRSSAQIAREFRRLLDGGALFRCAGNARDEPRRLLGLGYTPKCRIDLFDTTFYFTHARQNPDLRFFVVYVVQADVVQPDRERGRRPIDARIVYKDISLIWRTASHLHLTDEELWIGKGATRIERCDGHVREESIEATTDLPLEMQAAVESLNRRVRRPRHDLGALPLVLRNAPRDRLRPYRDFSAPRERAAANPRNRIYGGRKVLRFTRRDDPTSLRIARGFEPDFGSGPIEQAAGSSSLYGGIVRSLRFLSTNGEIQYLFFVGPEHAWLAPPQALTTELSTYGVRTVDVLADEDAFIPGYEYHFEDEGDDGPELHSQIPAGYAGAHHEHDDTRADASAWLDRLPVIRELRGALAAGRF